MLDDSEQLPNLQEVRRRLRDLHFNEYHRDNPARYQLYYQNIDGVIDRSRTMWERARTEMDSRSVAEDLSGGTPLMRPREAPRMTPPGPAAEAERRQSLRAWAIQ